MCVCVWASLVAQTICLQCRRRGSILGSGRSSGEENGYTHFSILVWRIIWTNACERRELKGKGEKERYTHLNAEFQRTTWRDKKAFLSDQCKKIEEYNRTGKTTDLV